MIEKWKKLISMLLCLLLLPGLLPAGLSGGWGAAPAKAELQEEINRILNPVMDTYMDGGVSPGTDEEQSKSFGTSSVMALYGYNDDFSSPQSHRIGLMKFDLNNLGSFNSAKLRMYCVSNCTYTAPDKYVSAYKISGDQWDEQTLTWLNRTDFPAGMTAAQLNGIFLNKTTVGGGAGWYEWDLTDYMLQQKAEDGIASIALRSQNQKVYFAASNSGNAAQRPYLLLSTDRTPPALSRAPVSGGNTVIDLQFDEPILNNLADGSALKVALALNVGGTGFSPLGAGDTVVINGNNLTVTMMNRLAVPGARIRLSADSLKDSIGNKVPQLDIPLEYDAESPAITSTAVSGMNKLVTLNFNESIISTAADVVALKAAVSVDRNSGGFVPLATGDTVTLNGNQLVITFQSALSNNAQIRIDSGVLRDSAGNAASVLTALAQLDFVPPIYQGGDILSFNKRIVLKFNEPLTAAVTDLKSVVTIERNGTGFAVLSPLDTVQISRSSLVLDLDEAISGQTRIKVAANSLKDDSGNILASEVPSNPINAYFANYPYPGFLTGRVEKAIALDMKTPADRGVVTEEYRKFVVLSTELARGERSSAVVLAFTNAVRKMITEYDYMPDVFGGLEARNNVSLTYGLALVWQQSDIMSQFTEAEKSKLITFLKAELVSSAYVLSDKNADGSARSNSKSRRELDGGTNSWPHTGPNYMEPIFGVMFAAQMVLGLPQSDRFLKTYDHNAFIAELEAQGLSRIKASFAKTTVSEIQPVVRFQSWSYKTSSGQIVTMKQLLEDPVKAFDAMEQFTFEHPAEEGHYMGQLGMLKEFHSSDSGGNRESSVYAKHGVDPALMNRTLLEYYGFMSQTAYPEARNRIEDLQKVGLDDYYTKVVNGFYTVSSTSAQTYYYSNDVMSEFAAARGLYQPAAWNDTFNYDPLATDPELTAAANWNFSGGSWTPEFKVIVPYNIKKAANSKFPAAGTQDPQERSLRLSGGDGQAVAYSKRSFGDIRYITWVQFDAADQIGLVGKVVDEVHYYALVYDHLRKKVAIQKKAGATVTTLAEASYALNVGKAYRFQADFIGQSIKFYIDGKLLLSATDSSASQTRGGVGFIGQRSAANFDAVVVQYPVPTAPELITIDIGENQLTLNYSKIPDAIGYKIRYGTAPGVYTQVLDTRRDGTETVPGLTNGTVYYFAVSSVTNDGESALSNEMARAPAVNTAVQPVLQSVVPAGSRVLLSFSTDPLNTEYTIHYGYSPGVYSNTITGVTYSNYEVPLSFARVPYYFAVSAANATGSSPNSNELTGQSNSETMYIDDFGQGAYGAYWTGKQGFSLTGDGQLKSASTGLSRAWLAAGYEWQDYSVSADITYTGTQAQQLLLLGRATNVNNYYLLGYYFGEYAILKKVDGGAVTKIAAMAAPSLQTGDQLALRAEFKANRISLYVNGQLATETTDSSLVSGTAGFLTNNTLALYDNLRVISAASEPPAEIQRDIIMDNGNADLTGIWTSSSYNANYYGNDYVFVRNGTGTETAIWRPNIGQAGNYEVYVWLPDGASNRSTSVPYSVYYYGGSQTYAVDQTVVPGGKWILLGVHPFAAGQSGYVQVANKTSLTIADAVRFVLVPDIVIDNKEASLQGVWTPSTYNANYYGSDYSYVRNGSGTETAVWRPDIWRSGNYEVYVWLPDGASNRNTSAPYTVYFDGGSQTYAVDQTVVPGGKWILLGVHPFAVGQSGYVKLANQVNLTTIADAVRFVYVR
ncbi:CBM96 family carbohydrate-binding protein [Paenibacillus sp. LjRoot56]|uniref:golvesin C-terminal-like domain-containing protein n=1 Tax=Paenibacillus sp. LjRoot56 TaxID=3342333 RepID=UPI003ECFD5B4